MPGGEQGWPHGELFLLVWPLTLLDVVMLAEIMAHGKPEIGSLIRPNGCAQGAVEPRRERPSAQTSRPPPTDLRTD
jgi:hypothetical protein